MTVSRPKKEAVVHTSAQEHNTMFPARALTMRPPHLHRYRKEEERTTESGRLVFNISTGFILGKGRLKKTNLDIKVNPFFQRVFSMKPVLLEFT